MLKLRENNKELKKTNDQLNKGIEFMLLQNVLRQSRDVKKDRLKTLLKALSEKCKKARGISVSHGPKPGNQRACARKHR